MTSGVVIDHAAVVLAAARRHCAEADAAQLRVFLDAVEWAGLHEVTGLDAAATWGESPVPLAGVGAPLVGEFCVAEFAAALGVSTDSGRALLAAALEIPHRLPRVWARVQAGDLPVWRARRIAEQTISLSVEAAAYVDRQVAPFAHKTGPVVTERLVDEAIGRFMPERAKEIAALAADGRQVRIDHAQVSFAGTSDVFATIDLADALDLDAALAAGAQQLAQLGSGDSLNVRRATALGVLARGEQGFGFETGAQAPVSKPRNVVLHVHLTPGEELATLEGHRLISAEQVRAWCGTPGARISVKPVIDLNQTLATTAYEPTETIRDHVTLREGSCC